LTLAAGDEAQVIGVGAAALLVLGGAVFKMASFRVDMDSKWAGRVKFATAALDEKTIAELEILRDEVEEILPASGGGFDPAQALADPASLSKRAEKTVKFYKARTRMQGDFEKLRALGPVFVGSLAVLQLQALLLTLYFSEILRWAVFKPVGLILLAGGLAVLIVAGSMFVFLQQRLANEQILAGTGGQAEAGQAAAGSPPNFGSGGK
jgi:hypothetical protein